MDNYKVLFLDIENTPHEIWKKVKKEYTKIENREDLGAFSFALDNLRKTSLKKWDKICNNSFAPTIQSRWIQGNAEKNKADKMIIREAEKLINNKKISTVCFMTSDGDFAPIINRLIENNKKVIVFGRENGSEKLKQVATKYISCDIDNEVRRLLQPLMKKYFSKKRKGISK